MSLTAETERGRSAQNLLNYLKDMPSLNGIDVQFYDAGSFSDMYPATDGVNKAAYNHAERRIEISEQFTLRNSDFNGAFGVVLAHEILHPIFRFNQLIASGAYNAGDFDITPEQESLIKRHIQSLEETFEQYKADPRLSNISNVSELFTEFLSDSNLRTRSRRMALGVS